MARRRRRVRRAEISRRLAKSGLGPTRDVVVIEGTTQTLDAHDVSSDMGDAFAAATGFDPRTLNHALPVSPNPPAAMLVWREVDELDSRDLMRYDRCLEV